MRLKGDYWPQWKRRPCGTSAAYRRHLRHGEPACPQCQEANRVDSLFRQEARRERLRLQKG